MKKNNKMNISYGYLIGILIFFSCFLCSGCAAAENVYESFSAFEATDEELKLLSEGKLTLKYERGQFDSALEYYKYLLHEYAVAGSTLTKTWGVILIPASIVIGIILILLARKSIQIRRIALFVFIVGIPVIIFLLIYGSAVLADMLQ